MTSNSLLDEFEARGLLQDSTDREILGAHLDAGPVTLYLGIDPTAESLHLGHLMGVLALRRFQLAGHRPIALVGGATGMVGDPSGRSEERNLLDDATLDRNVAGIRRPEQRMLVNFDIDSSVGHHKLALPVDRCWGQRCVGVDGGRDCR